MPLRADRVDADRDRHWPILRNRVDGRIPCRCLVRGLHRILEVEHNQVGPGSRALAIARGFDAGRNSTDRTANRSVALSLFASARVIAVASCPEHGGGEEKC